MVHKLVEDYNLSLIWRYILVMHLLEKADVSSI